ncbi:TPA: hypothetical protein QDB43_000340 [Burkholderia vietnamiensis]|nr:hypothetical protein [Burkholderia vietnamiensis]
MLSTTLPAFAYWATPKFYSSLQDPQGTADLLLIVLAGLFFVALAIGLEFWRFHKRHHVREKNLQWMIDRMEAFTQARREGRTEQMDPLDFTKNDIWKLEQDVKRDRRNRFVIVGGLSLVGMLVALCLAVIVICWGHWWIEGGYKCDGAVQPVHNQLDPEGIQQTVLGGRVNLCSPGLFTHADVFFGNPKNAIRETLN